MKPGGIASGGVRGGGITSSARAGDVAVGRAGGIEGGRSSGSIDAGKFSSRSFAAFRSPDKGAHMSIATRSPSPVFDRSPKNVISLGQSEKARPYASIARNNVQIRGLENVGRNTQRSSDKSFAKPRAIVFERPRTVNSPLIIKEGMRNSTVDRGAHTFPTRSPDKIMTMGVDKAPFRVNMRRVNGKPEFSIQVLPRQPDRSVTEQRYGKFARVANTNEKKKYYGQRNPRSERQQMAIDSTTKQHVDQLVKKFQQKNHTPNEKRRATRLAFGNAERAVQHQRLESVKNASSKELQARAVTSVSRVNERNSNRVGAQEASIRTSKQQNIASKEKVTIPFEKIKKAAAYGTAEERLANVRQQLAEIQNSRPTRRSFTPDTGIRSDFTLNNERFIQEYQRLIVSAPVLTERKKEQKEVKKEVKSLVQPVQEQQRKTTPLKVQESAADLRQAARVKLALMNLYFTREQAEEFVLPQLEEIIKKKQLPNPQLKQQVQTDEEWKLALELKDKLEEEEKLKRKLKEKTEEEDETEEDEANGKEKKRVTETPPEIIEEWDRDTDEYRGSLTEYAVEIAAVKTASDTKQPGILTGRVIANQLPIQQTPQMKSKLLYQIFAIGDMLRDGSWEKVRQQIANGGTFVSKDDAVAYVKKAIDENPAVRLNDTLETRPVTQKDIAKVLEYHEAVVPTQTKKGKFRLMSLF